MSICMYVRTCMYMCVFADMCVCVGMHVYMCTRVCMHACVYTYVRMCVSIGGWVYSPQHELSGVSSLLLLVGFENRTRVIRIISKHL